MNVNKSSTRDLFVLSIGGAIGFLVTGGIAGLAGAGAAAALASGGSSFTANLCDDFLSLVSDKNRKKRALDFTRGSHNHHLQLVLLNSMEQALTKFRETYIKILHKNFDKVHFSKRFELDDILKKISKDYRTKLTKALKDRRLLDNMGTPSDEELFKQILNTDDQSSDGIAVALFDSLSAELDSFFTEHPELKEDFFTQASDFLPGQIAFIFKELLKSNDSDVTNKAFRAFLMLCHQETHSKLGKISEFQATENEKLDTISDNQKESQQKLELLTQQFDALITETSQKTFPIEIQLLSDSLETELKPVLDKLETIEDKIDDQSRSIKSISDRVERIGRSFEEKSANSSSSSEDTSQLVITPYHQGETLNSPHLDSDGILKSLDFIFRKDKLIGRTQLLESTINKFVDLSNDDTSAKLFRWALFYGGAGSGKSRFAMELLRDAATQYKSEFSIDHWGFIDSASMDEVGLISIEKIRNIDLKGPAFIVIDHAASIQNLNKVIKAFADLSDRENQKVRLILLERMNEGGFIDSLFTNDMSGRIIRDTQFRFCNSPEVGIELNQLSDDECLQIIRERISDNQFLESLDNQRDWLLDRLDMIDSDKQRRPLYAAMVGATLANIIEKKEVNDWIIMGGVEARELMLEDLIKRSRENYWNAPKTPDFDRLESTLVLSTLCRGLERDTLKQIENEFSINIGPKFNERRYAKMVHGQRETTDSNTIGILTPDLVGEFYVLRSLFPKPGKATYNRNISASRKEIIEIAWRNRQSGIIQFIRQCMQNHPDYLAETDYLLPAPGKYLEQVIGVVRDLMDILRFALNRGSSENRENSVSEKHLLYANHARRLFRLLKEHINALENDKLSVKAEHEFGITASNYFYILSWTISKSLRDNKRLAENFEINEKPKRAPVVSVRNEMKSEFDKERNQYDEGESAEDSSASSHKSERASESLERVMKNAKSWETWKVNNMTKM